MDQLDKKILNIIQDDFPLEPEPYKEIACVLGISEEILIKRIDMLIEKSIIRQIGPVFSAHHLNYKTSLVAMEVPEEKLEEVVSILNSYHQVTHNYGRKHKYNLWFTLICESEEKLQRIIEEIKKKTGISEIYNLPYSKLFKIKVKFSF